MGKFNLSLLFLFISITLTTAQENLTPDNRPHKILNAQRISESPTVDGVLNDAVWQNITPSGDFNMYQPGNEGNIPQEFQSQVKMAYTDKAIYIAVYMYDPNPEGIFRQYSQRDDVFAQADRLAIAINTYNDGINETRFYPW